MLKCNSLLVKCNYHLPRGELLVIHYLSAFTGMNSSRVGEDTLLPA